MRGWRGATNCVHSLEARRNRPPPNRLGLCASLATVGSILRFDEQYALSAISDEKRVLSVLEKAATGGHDVLVVHGANPAYTLPQPSRVVEMLEQAPFVVAMASEKDETTDAADVVFPVHHPLESWDDYVVSQNTAGLMQPVRAPLFRSRHRGDLHPGVHRRGMRWTGFDR